MPSEAGIAPRTSRAGVAPRTSRAGVARHPLIGGRAPAWANGWGEDRHGVFMSFGVGKATQRLRWIPPGTFRMGSPESEVGRFEEECPCHLVTLTSGFWLADTPCTQALWQRVMDYNPSRFVSPLHPVEQVSWQDCMEFLRRLNGRLPGLEAKLPSEAQWERACRAGTDTATWLGELEILGQRNVPGLDTIAWHSGNCGEGFELEGGRASSDSAGLQPWPCSSPASTGSSSWPRCA